MVFEPPTHGISKPISMVFWPPYPSYFDLPIHLILTFRTHGILTLLPMVYRTPICGILTTLLMFCWTPNHGILTPTHVILTPYLWNIETPTHGILTPLLMSF
jgi:hypothetical protein